MKTKGLKQKPTATTKAKEDAFLESSNYKDKKPTKSKAVGVQIPKELYETVGAHVRAGKNPLTGQSKTIKDWILEALIEKMEKETSSKQ